MQSPHKNMPHSENIKQRVSESRAKRVWTLPSVSCFDQRSNIVKREQRMTDFVAFGECWRRLSHLGKFNTCQWHSAGTKFGHSNNFATLSLSLSLSLSYALTASPPHLIIHAPARVNIRLSMQKAMGSRYVFFNAAC